MLLKAKGNVSINNYCAWYKLCLLQSCGLHYRVINKKTLIVGSAYVIFFNKVCHLKLKKCLHMLVCINR